MDDERALGGADVMLILACPVCGGNAEMGRVRDHFRQFADCPKCGSFELSDVFEGDLRNPAALRGKRDLLPYLSAYIRHANQQGVPRPFFTGKNWEEFARAHANTPLHEKTIRLLSLLADRARPGKHAAIDPVQDAPLLDCFDSDEIKHLIQYLLKTEMIETKANGLGITVGYTLTIPGWELLAPAPAGTPGRCFVAMSFNPQLLPAWQDGIFPALKQDCRLDPHRADREEHNDRIDDRIIVEIRRAQFIVADVTGQRPGVYFEAGFAMGLGRPVIWTCREDDFANVHFDTRQYNHVVWQTPEELRGKLADRVRATILGVDLGGNP